MKLDIGQFKAPCPCGRPHPILLKEIVLEENALARLPQLLEIYFPGLQPTMICDNNTFEVAGRRILELLPHAARIVLDPSGLHANEHGVAMASSQLPDGCRLLLAVGSGTIHDITRYIAHQRGIPFVSVPTAASVDGFVSTVAAMTWKGFKKTFPAVAPVLVVADTSVIAKAPWRLTASGVCDLLGKYTALADWRISAAVIGEYFCERICRMEYDALNAVRGSLGELRAGSASAFEHLTYGLLLSGLAMQMCGNSRPASGAEHHLSHLWEMEAINPPVDAYHGQKVGVGLLICADIYHRAATLIRSGSFTLPPYGGLESDLLQKSFPPALLEGVQEENTPDPLASISTDSLHAHLQDILAVLQDLPTSQELSSLFSQVDAVQTMADIGLDPALLKASVQLSPYVRGRLTFMRLIKRFSFYQDGQLWR